MAPKAGSPTSCARLRASGEMLVHDISAAGVRVQGAARLLPGVHAELHLIGAAGRQLVRGRVVWARVRGVAPLVYEAAVAFDAPFDLLPDGYCLPGEDTTLIGGTEPIYPFAGPPRPSAPESAGKAGQSAGGRLLGSDTAGGERRDERRDEQSAAGWSEGVWGGGSAAADRRGGARTRW